MKNSTTMKTKHILAAMLALFMMFSGYYAQAQNTHDDENTKVPGHPGILSPTGGYFLTTDNENNALTGTADGDMDVYMYNDDPLHPIEFNIFTNDAVISSAQLSILAYDIDWDGGERDQVYVNGNYVGDLTGVNNTWTTSVFNFNPAFLIAGTNAKNLIRIMIDVNNVHNWAVTVDWAQIITNNTTGTATFRYVNIDKSSYCGGQCVQISEEVDADPSLSVRVETKLLDPANNALLQDTRTFTATTGNEPFNLEMCIPAQPTPGTWKIQAICYNAATNAQEDIKLVTFQVTNPCVTSVPTLSQWGLIILGFALLGFGTLYILRWRGTSA
jgi:hypothetical protein